MAESEEQDWAVFDKTTIHVTDSSNDWFNSTQTEEEPVCDITSSGNDEWQNFSSTGGFVSSHTDGRNKSMKDLNGIIAIDGSRHSSLTTDDVVTVIKDCFPSNPEDNTDNSKITHKLLSPNHERL